MDFARTFLSERRCACRFLDPRLEFQASPEGQAIIDEHEPISASFYTPGAALEKLLKGKKLSLVDWEQQHLKQSWMAKIIEAFNFPKAETSKEQA